MDAAVFIGGLNQGSVPNPENNVFQSIWNEYEKVVLHSLVTSFGLDFLVHDQYGGDVDTIHNVRKIDKDPDMRYKNKRNAVAYEKNGEYDTREYHADESFAHIKRDARREFDSFGTTIEDAYVEGNILYPRNNPTIPRVHQAQLDHVISAKSIHADRGRILSGLDGKKLANNPSNLRFTNADLNLNKSDMTPDEYFHWAEESPGKVNQGGRKGEPLDESVKTKMSREYDCSKSEYDLDIALTYYASPEFITDMSAAVGLRGAEMGLRQALGFVFVQLWISTEHRIKSISEDCNLEDLLHAVEKGIQDGFENVRTQYKAIFSKIEDGFTAGALASLTTTISNIFFTTAKNLVRYTRQIYASVVQAGKVLLFNPDNYLLGERIKMTSVILATGASVLVGTMVGEAISLTPIGAVPEIGRIVTTFCSSLVSGLLSCSLLVFLDRSKFINSVISSLNEIPSDANNYREIADALEVLAAKIGKLDIEQFKTDVEGITSAVDALMDCDDQKALNTVLLDYYTQMELKLPWTGDFDSFMSDRDNRLQFG